MTEGQLFDFLREKFGVGNYQESEANPYWKWRNVEVTKLKGMLRKRQTTADEMKLVADYCIASGITITAPWQLLGYIGEAKKAEREARSTPTKEARERLVDAASEAWERGQHEWAARLLNTASSEADFVLAEYREETGGDA